MGACQVWVTYCETTGDRGRFELFAAAFLAAILIGKFKNAASDFVQIRL